MRGIAGIAGIDSLYLYYSLIYLVTGDPFVSIVEEQDKELTRLRALESAVKKIFNDDQIRKLTTGKNVHYSLDTIQQAVMTYAQVGSTHYEFFRETWNMPIPALSTIRNHLKGIDSSPGILKDFFTMTKKKLEKITDPRHKKFGLLVDQMALGKILLNNFWIYQR